MNTHTEPINSTLASLNRTLHTLLSYYPHQIPSGLLISACRAPLPAVARNPKARATLATAIAQRHCFLTAFPALEGVQISHVTWTLDVLDATHIIAKYAITLQK